MSEGTMTGKTLVSFEMTEDRLAMRFTMADGGKIVAICNAECCSETWIEHVSMPAFGLPATVLEAYDVDMPDLGDMPGRDVVQYYGFKVVTDKGDLLIDYRNDSNGYYGGSLSWYGGCHYGGVFWEKVKAQGWRTITQDE